MTPAEIRNLITMLVLLAGAAACFSYAFTNQIRKAKKSVYKYAGIEFLVGAVFYAFGAFDLMPDSVFRKLLMTGWLSAILFYLLTAMFIMIIITDWRIKK